ncbi:hypothetical protein K3495_g328 [Podosphaera aphanis]|nr:hypothetical protein K3495_g328 [Podosphaera aphanis]
MINTTLTITGTYVNKNPANKLNRNGGYPIDLRPVVEAEERRSAQIAAQLSICATVMETVDIALSKIQPDENREYIDSIKVYLGTVIANFGRTGLGTVAPMLPPDQHIRHLTPTSTRLVAAPLQAQKPEKSSLASPKENRVFLRLPEGHKWREISPAGIRKALVGLRKCAPSEVGLVQRVRTGFAITARNEEIRKKLLASSEELTPMGAKLEPSSNLVAIHIVTVPVAIDTLGGRVHITEEMVVEEIARVTNSHPTKTIAAGDFNAVHEAWQAGTTRPHEQGDIIEKWAETHNLSCLIIGEPTHRADNTLDLTWTNISNVAAWVDYSECVTSNYLPIRGQVPIANSTPETEPPSIRVTRGNLPRFSRVISQWASAPLTLGSPEIVETYAQDLCTHLSNAIKATETRRAVFAETLLTTIAAAKKEYQTSQVEAMTTPAAIFKLMREANPRQASPPPLLIHEGALVTEPAERATILRDALLARYLATDDLTPCDVPSDN